MSPQTVSEIEAWLTLRHEVYSQLMPSKEDFVGKLMLLYAAVIAARHGDLKSHDWHSDFEFLNVLLNCQDPAAQKAVSRWLLYELWSASDLSWFESNSPPTLSALMEFNKDLSSALGRECFSYRIADKRSRLVKIRTDTGSWSTLGNKSRRWMFGAGSPLVKDFTRTENDQIRRMVQRTFDCEFVLSAAVSTGSLFE